MSNFLDSMRDLRREEIRSQSSITQEQVLEQEVEQEILEDPVIKNPLPFVPGTYGEDDIVSNDDAFSIVESYMLDRYGIQSVQGLSREKIVDDFLDNRRGVSGGNTVRGIREMNFLNDIKDDKVKMARTAKAYALYENMANLFSKDITPYERVRGVGDYIRTTVFDPINVLGAWVGKAAGGGSVRLANNVAQKLAVEAMQKEVAKGGSKEAVKKAGAQQFKKAIKELGEANVKASVEFTSGLAKSRGFKRLASSGTMREVLATTSIDAVVNAGMDTLYQNGLIMTGVQDEFSVAQTGIAALGSLVIGGATAGRIIARGELGPRVSPLTGGGPETKNKVLQDLTEELKRHSLSKTPITSKWTAKVKRGKELSDQDSQFFIDLLIGIKDPKNKDEVIMEGITHFAAKNNLYWVTSVDDNIGNWVAEIIKASDQETIDNFVEAFQKATGNKLRQISSKKMTPEMLADTFANKISQSAKNLNALKQVADRNSISLEDLTLETFIASELDLPYTTIMRGAEEVEPSGFYKFLQEKAPMLTGISSTFTNAQNKIIRLLVANPGTSALNVLGWGANTSLNTVTDLALAVLYAGKGSIQKAIFQSEKGTESFRIASQLLKSNYFKGKTILDPSLSRAQFEIMLARNEKAMQELSSVLPGGVDNASKFLTDGEFSKNARMIDLGTEKIVDTIQAVSLVKAQDKFTKSVEFISQMDRALRLKFNKGWDEFYSDPMAQKLMQTKEYAQIEALAVERTLEAVLSKSFKDNTSLGKIAGFIEDARNIPGIGLLVPFGRFFNNTVDFGLQSSGLAIAGKMMRFYPNKTYEELAAKSLVSYGLVWTMVDNESENRKKGLGLYQSNIGGEVINQQYDYPVSLFKAAARYISYLNDGEEPPEDLLNQIARDFTLKGLLRNLDETNREMGEFVFHAFNLEFEEARKRFKEAVGGIGSQAISASTRFLEPVDITVGLIKGKMERPIDRNQGNKFLNKSFRYFDNIAPIFFGEKASGRPTLQQAASGEADVTGTKMFGIRPVRLTNTQRVMNMMGISTFELNAESKIRRLAPESANEYNRIMFDIIESKSKALLSNKAFLKAPLETQQNIWRDRVVEPSKRAAKDFISLQFRDPDRIVSQMYKLVDKYTPKQIDEAIEDLNMDRDLDEMSRSELIILQEYLGVKDTLEKLRDSKIMREQD